jgi:rubredoxin
LLKKENPEKGFKELEVIYEKRASCQKCTHVFTDEEADNHDLYQEPHCEMLIGDKGGKLSEFLPERIIGGTESGPASKLYVCPVCSEVHLFHCL